MFCIQVSDINSIFVKINSRTIQGFILGPILYAIFVAPLYNITKLSNFADDNFAIALNKNKDLCIKSIEHKIQLISKSLTNSGLKVTEIKTEIFIFFRKDTPQVDIMINNTTVKSKDHMNVLGVIFDSILTWTKQVANQANKANSLLHAIQLIRKFFTQEEILTLLISNFNTILFYNSEVWHIPNSVNTLKLTQKTPNFYESFIIHHCT